MVEKQEPNSSPILGKDLEGLTWSEIHQRLAPGKPVPAEVANLKTPFALNSGSQNGYKACMLNQTGWTWAWVGSYCNTSSVDINPWRGSVVHIRGKMGDQVVFDYDMLAGGYAHYYFWMTEGRNGSRIWVGNHRYDLTAAPGHAWHWAFRGHT